MIDWKAAQTRLVARGYAPGTIDGEPGKLTYAALFAFVAACPVNAVIADVGAQAAKTLAAHGIDASPPRLAEFIAQTCNETGGYRLFEENLKYSAEAIHRCWPGRFPTVAAAAAVAWDPKDADREDMVLASRVYGQRMGNLPAAQDTDNQEDGWQYRGRGLLELTGRANYRLYGQLTGLPLEAHPELAADPADSLTIAAAFWTRGFVNEAVDHGNFTLARKITNGGAIGLEHVADLRQRALQVLS